MSSQFLRVDTEPDLGPIARLNRVLPWLIGLAVFCLVLVRYIPQIHKNEEMRRQLQRKTEEVQRLEAEVYRLRAENNALDRDPRTIERTAREQLSLARPDERVVTFQDLPSSPTRPSASTPAEMNRRSFPPSALPGGSAAKPEIPNR